MMGVSDQCNQMTLQGHVRILRQGDMAQQMMLSTVRIFPSEQRAQTDMPVFRARTVYNVQRVLI